MKYEAATGKKVTAATVRRIMKEQLGMRYRKIIKLPPKANHERCKKQRQ